MNVHSPLILPVESFEVPGDMTKQQEDAYRRRFSILQLDADPHVRRGSFTVRKAHTAEGRLVAVCACSGALWDDGDCGHESIARMRDMLKAEQAELARLSLFRCYPAVYGLGMVQGVPVLIEDWIEGVSLEDVRRMLPSGRDGSGMAPLHVALIGAKLYRLLETLEEYGASGAARGISADSVIVEAAADGLPDRLENRDFNLRFSTYTGRGDEPSDILLALLGVQPGRRLGSGEAGARATRDERDALAYALEYGKFHRYESGSMKRMIQRWIRVHDNQRLKADGSAPYSYRIDPRVFIPQTRSEERPRFRFGSRIIAESLDSGEGDVDWVAELRAEESSASWRQRILWWSERNFMAIWVVLMLIYTAVVFAVGWMLYP